MDDAALLEFIQNTPPEQIMAALENDEMLADWWASQGAYYLTFKPRPDRPELFDEQESYVNSRDIVSFLVAGNASGKTEASARKCAEFLLRRQEAPRRDCPFWILSDTMEIVTSVCWQEKLLGNGHIPSDEIQWDRIVWHSEKNGQPKSVPLKPWPKERGGDPNRNWKIEFKSYEQGRQALQARAIGGFWFSEQFPVGLFTESLVRCREYLFPGGQFAEFTPLEPDLCVWLERLMEKPPADWKFYRCNTECNAVNLADKAIETFIATTPDELVETRLRGALASFEGSIYPQFQLAVHVLPDDFRIPAGCWHCLGTDWGASAEHPHATVWAATDGMGCWYLYDEYWYAAQDRTGFDHAQEVVKRCHAWGWPVVSKMHPSIGRHILMVVPDAFHGMNFADPSRPGEIHDFSSYGVPTMAAFNEVYTGISEVRRLLKIAPPTDKPKLFISKRCRHIIDEMRKYRWMRGKRPSEGVFLNPKAPKPVPLKRDDDTVDALRYAVLTGGRMRGGAAGVETARRDDAPKATHSPLTGMLLPPGLAPRSDNRR